MCECRGGHGENRCNLPGCRDVKNELEGKAGEGVLRKRACWKSAGRVSLGVFAKGYDHKAAQRKKTVSESAVETKTIGNIETSKAIRSMWGLQRAREENKKNIKTNQVKVLTDSYEKEKDAGRKVGESRVFGENQTQQGEEV